MYIIYVNIYKYIYVYKTSGVLKDIIAIKSQICAKHYPQKYEANCIRPARICSPDVPATTHPKPPPFNICFKEFSK